MFCAFFKQGLCKKGDKCKFSHDPDVEKKAAKRNVFEAKVYFFFSYWDLPILIEMKKAQNLFLGMVKVNNL